MKIWMHDNIHLQLVKSFFSVQDSTAHNVKLLAAEKLRLIAILQLF